MKKSQSNHWILIGRIVRPFGIKGGLKVHFQNPESDTLRVGQFVRLEPALNVAAKEFELEKILPQGRLFLKGILDRNAAEELRDAKVFLRRSSFPDLAENEVFLADLIGAQVLDQEGHLKGVIESFSSNNVQPLAEVKTPEGKRISVPFVKELILEISNEGQMVKMELPAGLFDEV